MSQIIENIEKAHRVLNKLDEPVTYVGGAVVPLYMDDPAAAPPRPTRDVDTVVRATSYREYVSVQEELRDLGLRESREPEAPECRWEIDNLQIDVMPVHSSEFGFTNRWYEKGVRNAIEKEIAGGVRIQVFAPPYLFADKINTFEDRGNEDYYGSPDFEDLIRLLDGCTHLIEDIKDSGNKVRNYIVNWMTNFLEKPSHPDYINAHLRDRGRAELIVQKCRELIADSDH